MAALLRIAPVALAVLLAGCFHAAPGGTSEDTPPPASISSVTLRHAAATAATGSKALVCWEVAGTGSIPHTAVHWDTESRATAAGAAAYTGGATYPANATSQVAVTLPGSFCSTIPVPSTIPAGGKLFVRAHAMITAPGVLSANEMSIRVVEAGADVVTAIDVLSINGKVPTRTGAAAPLKVAANETFTVCWKVSGKGNATRSHVHWDERSHNATPTLTALAYPRSAYADNRTQSESHSRQYPLNATYCTGIRAPSSGKVFLRAFAVDAEGPRGKLSPEYEVAVAGKVTAVTWVTNFGTLVLPVAKNTNMTVCWRLEGVGVTPHTAVHTDSETHAGEDSIAGYDQAWYPDNATAQAASGYAIPQSYCTNVKTPAAGGNLYLRAHAISVDGHRFSEEKVVTVSPV